MPISGTDPRYLGEYIPPQLQVFIAEARRRFNLPASHVGAKGDLNHASGYHRSRSWVLNSPDSRYFGEDYSVRSADDQRGDANWLAAVDISLPTSTLITVCRRLKAASDAGDPRLFGWREFLGTLNGSSTYGWDFISRYAKTPDRSHLWHLHLSRTRRYADTPMTAILDVMIGDDDVLTPTQVQQLDNVHEILIDLARGQSGNIHPHVPDSPVNSRLKAAADGVAALLARPTVDLTDAQLDVLASKVVAQLGPLLPSAEDLNAAVDAAIEERLNGATIRTAGH